MLHGANEYADFAIGWHRVGPRDEFGLTCRWLGFDGVNAGSRSGCTRGNVQGRSSQFVLAGCRRGKFLQRGREESPHRLDYWKVHRQLLMAKSQISRLLLNSAHFALGKNQFQRYCFENDMALRVVPSIDDDAGGWVGLIGAISGASVEVEESRSGAGVVSIRKFSNQTTRSFARLVEPMSRSPSPSRSAAITFSISIEAGRAWTNHRGAKKRFNNCLHQEWT